MENLYTKIYISCVKEIEYGHHSLLKDMKEILPDVLELSKIIFDYSNFDMEEEDYILVRNQFIEILSDLTEGIEAKDEVMVLDAAGIGLLDFLNMFLPEDENRGIIG